MKIKSNLYTVILVTIIVIVFGIALACTSSSPEEEPTLEYKLAVINEGGYVDKDDPIVSDFKDLVQSIDEKSIEGPTEIADILVKAQELLWDEYRIKVSLLELTIDLERSLPNDSKNLNFEEIAVLYITLLGESQ